MRFVIRFVLNWFAGTHKFSDVNTCCIGLFGDKVGQILELVIQVLAVLHLLENFFHLCGFSLSFFLFDPELHFFHVPGMLINLSAILDLGLFFDVLKQLWLKNSYFVV